ncbi:hypothetical protein GCM10009096_27620 [Parasphingorhabdus litoris]|uniref:Glycoside hydrolase family 28 protein n=1 Tax=Parasphingorhabdus litoris TaxID=394733 RepID=A0ABN1ATK8_9SPHN|nr:glycosyl hydrolase family 28 protein [Parasphingorhabdus litoris]
MTHQHLITATKAAFLLSCAVPISMPAVAKDSDNACNPETHGAVPNDGKLDMVAIQAAIDACGGTGGIVRLSAGEWHTGLLTLRPAMEFHLAAGAVLTLVPDMKLYPERIVKRPDGTVEDFHTAIHAPDARDLVISGPGRIEGNGEKFWDANFYELGIPRSTLPRPAPLLSISDCSNVSISGLQFNNIPAYALSINRCEDVRLVDITIRNDPRSPNTDGIQIRDSADIFITRADIKTGDDGIVLKSRLAPIDNLVVTDSIIESDDAAIKFGTRSEVGVTNSIFSDIVIRNSRYGIAIFQIDGGAHLDNRFHNMLIETGGRHARQYPIFIDIDRREPDDSWGRVERLTFSDIDIKTTGASLLAGNANAPIRDLVLSDINVNLPNGEIDLSTGRKPRGSVTIAAQEDSADYSRQSAHFAFAHIQGLVLDNVSVNPGAKGTKRQPSFMNDVTAVGNVDVIGPKQPIMQD